MLFHLDFNFKLLLVLTNFRHIFFFYLNASRTDIKIVQTPAKYNTIQGNSTGKKTKNTY